MKDNSIKVKILSEGEAKDKGFIPSGEYFMVLDGPITSAITGAEAPTDTTEGKLGQLFVDTTTGNTYMCVAVGETYTWKQLQFSE